MTTVAEVVNALTERTRAGTIQWTADGVERLADVGDDRYRVTYRRTSDRVRNTYLYRSTKYRQWVQLVRNTTELSQLSEAIEAQMLQNALNSIKKQDR